jgi:serine/threonine protein kinase
MPRLVVPVRVREWQLLELLGRGGEAETWRARRDGPLEDEVCLRIPFAALQTEERRDIIEEAALLARVRHAHVVTLLDLVEDERGRLVMVLELVRGLDLKELGRRLSQRKILPTAAAVAHVGRAVCLALAGMQRAVPGGAVHRDVSPHNVLCSRDGDVKLADFGIARRIARERRTRTGVWKGKAAYVAPEVIQGDAADVKSDLFSLGVLLYELSAGTRPFSGHGCMEILEAITAGVHVDLRERATRLPPELAACIERLLSGAPSSRPTPDEAARAFGTFSGDDLGALELAHWVRVASGPQLAKSSQRRRALLRPPEIEAR